MSSKFPQTLFVHEATTDDGKPFFIASESLDLHTHVEGDGQVARYQLVEIGEVHTESMFVVTEKAKKS